MDQKPQTTKPTDGQKEQATTDEQKQSRREFVTRMAKRAAYVAPAVIALSANKSAFGSGGSGVS